MATSNEVKEAIETTVAKTDYDEISNKKAIKLEGKVKEKKKSLGDKFSETFLSEDINTVKGFIFTDVVLPALRNLLYDSISNTASMLIFGTANKGKNFGNGGPYRDYNSISKSGPSNRRPVVNDNTRDRFDFRDLVFDQRRDAEEVLYTLFEYIREYGHATVADYYNSIPGVNSVYTDKDWGWTDLRDATVRPVRDGFVITLPRPVYRPDSR